MKNEKSIPKFSCKLTRGNLSLGISVEFNIVRSQQIFITNEQAIRAAHISAQQLMQKGWKLVMLNGQKVKQGRLVIPSPLATSKIEKAYPLPPNTRLPLGDGTAQ